MSFVGIVVVIAVAVAFIAQAMRRERARLAWAEFARRLGLAHDPGAFLRSPCVTGAVDGFPIVLDTITRGAGKSRRAFTRLVVGGRGRIPRDLAIGPEDLLSTLKKAFGDGDIDTGDAAFDAATRIWGDPILALAVLGSDTRRQIARALAQGVTVGNGEIRFETRGLADDAYRLVSLTESMTALAGALSIETRSIPKRLLENVRSDNSPVVRKKSLEALIERYELRPETAEAARAALGDRSDEMRVLAAETLPGDEGFEALAGVALSEIASEGARLRAIAFLARRFDAARSGPVIETALVSRSKPVRLAAVSSAGALRHRPALPRLVSMADAVEGDVAAAVAEALGEIGDAEGEGAALVLLASEESRVRVAAARALERIGGRSAVEPLLALTGGILPFGELRAAATSAVRAIQSRLGPAERGGLSMADILRTDGALGFSKGEGGLSTPGASAEEPASGVAPPSEKRGDRTS